MGVPVGLVGGVNLINKISVPFYSMTPHYNYVGISSKIVKISQIMTVCFNQRQISTGNRTAPAARCQKNDLINIFYENVNISKSKIANGII
jgi:hypothetical protein